MSTREETLRAECEQYARDAFKIMEQEPTEEEFKRVVDELLGIFLAINMPTDEELDRLDAPSMN